MNVFNDEMYSFMFTRFGFEVIYSTVEIENGF